ncbi:MAG: cytochrome d ubiquinol oxidase subunit II [Chitinophagaceae bacterium]
MRFPVWLLFVLGLLSALSGYLLSRASLVGRAGINLFYKEYKFLKTGWQGALLVFVLLVIVLLAHHAAQTKLAPGKRLGFFLTMLLLALTGLFFTYSDFRHTLSHRLLGERFHLGGYLFWIGWMITSITYLLIGERSRQVRL